MRSRFSPRLALAAILAAVLLAPAALPATGASLAAAAPGAVASFATAPAATVPPVAPRAAAASPATPGQENGDADKRPLELADVLAWKRINSARLSNDGAWFAYRLTPGEGDSEVVVRSTTSDTEHRFDVGETPGGFSFGSSAVSFSEDSRWVAFTIYPDRAAAERNRERRRPSRNDVGLLELSTGEMTEFENVRGYAFNGEDASWIALHKYAPEPARGGGRAGGPGDGPGGNGNGEDPPRGSDLILHELATGAQLNVGNVAEFSFDEDGRRLAWVVDTEGKAGNGVQLRDMDSGVVRPLDSGEARYRRLGWTEEGDALAVLKGVEHEDYEDPLYEVLGFQGLEDGVEKVAYDPADDETFPEGMGISENRSPSWTEERDALLFGIHEVEMKEPSAEEEEQGEGDETEGDEDEGEGEDESEGEEPRRPGRDDDQPSEEETPDLVLWHWKDPRLQSMQQVQERRDENFSYLASYRVEEERFVRLADDLVDTVSPTEGDRWAVGYDDDPYELTGNLSGRRYRDLWVVDMHTGDRRKVLERARWAYGPSTDGTHFLYFEDGHFHTLDLETGESWNITEDLPTSFINDEADYNVEDPPIFPLGWSEDGEQALLYDNWDIWAVDRHGGSATNLTVDGKEERIRYRRLFRLDPDDDGWDLSDDLWLAPYGEWTKKSGIGRIEAGTTGVDMLTWDDAASSSLLKAEDADVYAYTRETVKEYPDYRVTDASFADSTRLTDANPQQEEFLWTAGSRLVEYESEQGDRLQGALFLPAGHEPGERYPTIVYIYEELSQGKNRYDQPTAYGFDMSFYTSNGYAVLMPDITYQVNDPGMSAVWCVLPALEAAVDTGVVDPERVAIHGHSWGGYQTSFLVTQTDAFAAAVAGAPLTNLISMYSSIYWNSGSANQPIFESSQGRFTGDYIETRDAYIRNSPVFFADRVQTPLIILHNDQDGAVDWNQGIEYYNTLRRLGKEVVMLQYVGENHGLRKPANRKDYFIRMKEFFDHHLKGAEAPSWYRQGIPHLQLEEHLEERARMINPKVGQKTEKEKGGDKGESGPGGQRDAETRRRA